MSSCSEFTNEEKMAKTILAVDDSASIRQMVSFTLKSAGYDVVEAVDGMDGLEKAKAKSINLVLTDQNMPRMDGLTLIKSLRAYRNMPRPHPDADHRVFRCNEGAGACCWCDRLAGQTVSTRKN
jgi:CheY-like chemotaxis protein